MSTLAWFLLLTGILILRQVQRGRVMNIGEDLADAFLAIATGDTTALNEVLKREGEADEPAFARLGDAMGGAVIASKDAAGQTADLIGKAMGGQLDGLEEKANNSLALWAVALGEKAKGYRFTATGPDYYDCSGLMYRAAQRVGYKGGRFTTSTIGVNKAFQRIPNGTIDDIVCWPGKHMGVVTGSDQFYSARSVKSGIDFAKISTWNGGGRTPVYYRLVKK